MFKHQQATRSLSHPIGIDSRPEYEIERVWETNDEGHVAEQDEGVRLQHRGEHVDVDRHRCVGDNSDQKQIELHECEE